MPQSQGIRSACGENDLHSIKKLFALNEQFSAINFQEGNLTRIENQMRLNTGIAPNLSRCNLIFMVICCSNSYENHIANLTL